MNRESISTAAAALVLTLAPGGAPAQSLAELARQEKARRAAVAPEDRAPVLTNDDLRGRGGLTVGTLPPEARAGSGRAGRGTAAGREGGAGTEDPEDGGVPGEDEWRARMTAAREARARAELTASALQNRADGLWAQFTALDDPARRGVVERQRAEALAELDRTRAEAERLEQRIHDVREEARRAGVPPGWLR